jgi:DNA repair protein RadC
MSESEESLKVSIPVTPANDVVPIYRVTLVREPTVLESLRTAVRKSSEAAELMRPLFTDLDREHFVVLMLDAQHRPIGVNIVSIGSLTASVVHARETFKPAILSNSAAVIVAHNHPSNSVEPSPEDIELSRRLREAGELLGIRVLDSIIIGAGSSFYSFVDAGRW